jgi:ABC-type taurine transport system substrate-binding protein
MGGRLIMTGAEHISDIGISTYDVVSIPAAFGERHPEIVTAF